MVLTMLLPQLQQALQSSDWVGAIAFLNQAITDEPTNPRLHNTLGNVYKKTNALDLARASYQTAIHLNPAYAEAHHNLAALYALQGDYQQALSHYREAVHAKPDFIEAHYNLGLLLLKQNHLDPATIQFQNVLALNPAHLQAHFYLGVLALNRNDLKTASHSFQQVLAFDPEHVFALINTGVIALKEEHSQLAVDYFTKALALDNNNVEARYNLAATFIHHDRFENALTHYQILLEHDPKHLDYLYNAGVAQMALGHLQEACDFFHTLLTEHPDHFEALSNLAAIHTRLGDRTLAATLLEQALHLRPTDEATQFMLCALTRNNKQPPTAPTYVTHLFDHYALTYDGHLEQVLHYELPKHISRLIHQLPPITDRQCLDLGCGTGLSGAVLRESSQTLTGVDLSPKMLKQADKKGIYDRLVTSELVLFLEQEKSQYDLIVAADVLPYLGDLEPLFSALLPRLTPQGHVLFSHEISPDLPWQLQASARFSHSPDYLLTLCAEHGLQVVHQEPVLARMQEGNPLYVMLYTLKR